MLTASIKEYKAEWTALAQTVRFAAKAENIELMELPARARFESVHPGYLISTGTQIRFQLQFDKDTRNATGFRFRAVYPHEDENKLDIHVLDAITNAMLRNPVPDRTKTRVYFNERQFSIIPADKDAATAEMRRYFRIHKAAFENYDNHRTGLDAIARAQGESA